MPLLGTETEYGILAPEAPGLDAEWLAERVVEAHEGPATPVLGAIYNRVLGNGARLYVDHGHPEYSTPETTDPDAATAHDLAGDLLVARAAAAASERAGTPIRVFKNNTDGQGNSYGAHENYLVARGVDWGRLEGVLALHLVSRTVCTGAGRVGLGAEPGRRGAPGFQLSQRADFFERVSGLDTTRRRGIVNTRDEPHATASAYRRLHVIAGDANRNPFATWLKLGAAALVVAAVEAGGDPGVRLADPVGAFRTVSRDLTLSARLPLAGGGAASALDLQRRLLDACARWASGLGFAGDVLEEWARALDDLAADPTGAADRLDWPAKLGLLRRLRERDALGWDDPRLARLDLAWAELDAPASPVAALRRAGRLIDWVPDADVADAAAEPPRDTRAYARGRLVADHADAVVAATWDSVLLRDRSGRLHPLRMGEPRSWRAGEYEAALAALPPL